MIDFDRTFVFDESRQKGMEQKLYTGAYHFFHKHFDLEYWMTTGFQVRKEDSVVEIFVLVESESKIIEMVYEMDEGDFQR